MNKIRLSIRERITFITEKIAAFVYKIIPKKFVKLLAKSAFKKVTSDEKCMWFFDESIFDAYQESENLIIVVAVCIREYDKFCTRQKALKRKIGVSPDCEIKWNDTEVKKEIGTEKYEDYRQDFVRLIINHCQGFFAVSQESKQEGLELLLKGIAIPYGTLVYLDNELVENNSRSALEKRLNGLDWKERDSASSAGLQAADFFAGMLKLYVKQNGDLSNNVIWIDTPEYNADKTPVEFIIRMQMRHIMPSVPKNMDITTKTELTHESFLHDAVGLSVFIGKSVNQTVRNDLEKWFSNVYMGCTA